MLTYGNHVFCVVFQIIVCCYMLICCFINLLNETLYEADLILNGDHEKMHRAVVPLW